MLGIMYVEYGVGNFWLCIMNGEDCIEFVIEIELVCIGFVEGNELCIVGIDLVYVEIVYDECDEYVVILYGEGEMNLNFGVDVMYFGECIEMLCIGLCFIVGLWEFVFVCDEFVDYGCFYGGCFGGEFFD